MITIRRTVILTTNRIVYTAWEPSGSPAGGCGHATVFYDDREGWLGKIGTTNLPPAVAVLPVGPERIAVVRAFHAAEYERAYAAIIAEYPHLADAPRDMGEVTEYLELELQDDGP